MKHTLNKTLALIKSNVKYRKNFKFSLKYLDRFVFEYLIEKLVGYARA